MKRFTALAMAAVMTVGMAVSAGAASFSDINDVPWEGAKEYINSVSDLGLMVGDNDSSGNKVFRANDRVTYCEAMQLAYSVLNETGGLKTTEDTVEKWTSTMEAANIPEWAYTAVSYGLESGVVSSNDITIFMKSATENREATRENVAVIFGKALSHLYDVDSDAVLTFSDADSISSTSVPYVDLLARLNIFVGDDSNNFNPKNYINRAEMAVIVSKSYNILTELAAEQEEEEPAVSAVTSTTGTVILVDNSSTEKTIALSDENAQVSTYTISSSTPVISLDGETKTYADVSVGDNLTVTTTNGIVVSIIINDDDEAEEEEKTSNVLEGYLDNITNKAITFNNDDGDQLRYELASNVSISMNGGAITDDDLYEYVIDRNIIYITVTLNSSGLVESIVAEFCDISGELMDFDDGDAYVKFVYGDKS
ncbi:MAG: S-layer homology domain-containing protein, partial [Clostridiales bacterium]|nr:S-layer homology domain-containing protein [Clostridiales bacterium]